MAPIHTHNELSKGLKRNKHQLPSCDAASLEG